MDKKQKPSNDGLVVPECGRTRLAESSTAAVDVCVCGILQLNMGPMTLRMAPCAVVELIATLEQAIARLPARRGSEDSDHIAASLTSTKRGQA